MGHTAGKDVFRKLGAKIDGLPGRAPWSEELRAILKELYSVEEAELVIRMGVGLATLEEVARATGFAPDELRPRLEALADKGLVIDLLIEGDYYYQPSPMVIGIFEFTMMRTRGALRSKQWAELFSAYIDGGDVFWKANRGAVQVMRSLPHEKAVIPGEYTEVLDHEKAVAIVEQQDRWAVGICSCRHEKHHLGEKECDVSLESCTSFGHAADYLVRHGFARDVSKQEMLDRVQQSWESGLVMNADNVKHQPSFICHCCACCCHALHGISKHGFPGTLVTSNYIARTRWDECNGCGVCAKDCPIDAIAMTPSPERKFRKFGKPVIDEKICLGCGVCTRRCKSKSLKLTHREQRVLHPETTFERVILQCLERGTLQNQLFDDPRSKSQAFLRGVVGGFLRLPPVKKALMSNALRSRFLSGMKKGVSRQGKGWILEL